MAETQIFAVKCKPANGIRAAAVNFVADDREALLGQMNTDLMLAPGFQLHANQARFRTAFHNVSIRVALPAWSGLRSELHAVNALLPPAAACAAGVNPASTAHALQAFTAGAATL